MCGAYGLSVRSIQNLIDFKDIVDYIEKFQKFYFGFEGYLQHKRDLYCIREDTLMELYNYVPN
ncbi:hypothetical protein DU80_11600 [Methanosarcina mazei]|uniref:Uncharacterized protein n=1 Tax=Methanosarcina mazei TaxID=2209 RepID=A0A0F8SLU6_METMZ|nr:hypothetical protein DU47_04275 [Methanosarcina mazei]KKG57355.1 hypothetical protein DU33_15415 [Methanosarcina mazei]KKG60914.1 hypothetical protein DU45_15740 [Methanosarcina mazei]KKG64076.1 hypothetical protein DU64_14825 [Methanosarcina mazei]KKH91385.1 hypothetical protein DU80_11600 [Methanosarcina mazei]